MVNKRFVSNRYNVYALALLTALCLGSPEVVRAESKIKKLVFENCEQAEVKMRELPAEQKPEFLSYLVRVLKMQIGISSELASDAPPAAPVLGPRDGIVSGNMWSLFEPSRELEAKQCALKLLMIGENSQLALIPDLISVLQETSLDPEFRATIESTIWNTTKAVSTLPKSDNDQRVYSALISQLQSDSVGYIAGNVLIELRHNTLPYLLAALSSPDLRRQQLVQNLLLRLDREGNLIGPVVLRLLESGDPLLRAKAIRLLSSVKGFFSQSLTAVILRLGDPAPEVAREAFLALKGFFSDPAAVKTLSIDASAAPLLFQMLQRANPEARSILEPAISLLLSGHPELHPQVTALVKSPDADLRERGVRFLGISSLPSDIAFPLLFEALYDPAFSVRLSAVRTLGTNNSKAEEKASALLKALKRSVAEKDARVHQQFVLAIAEVVTKLPLRPIRMAPYFVDALRYEPNTDVGGNGVPQGSSAIDALVHIGREVEGQVTKALKDSDAVVRRRAIIVLSKIAQDDRQIGKSIVFMLRDGDEAVRAEAERALFALGPNNIDEIRKGLEWKEFESKLAAARLLAAFGEKGPKIVDLLRDSFGRAECHDKIRFVDPLIKVDAQFKEKIQPFLVECLLQDEQTDLKTQNTLVALKELAPLNETAKNRLMEILKSETTSSQTRLKVLVAAESLGLTGEERAGSLALLLHGSDNVVKDEAASLLSAIGKPAVAAVPELKKLADDDDADGALRNRAVFALAGVQPEAFDWEKFFLRELDSEHSQWAVSVLAEMKPETAVPFLDRALKKVSPEKRAQVVTLIAGFGPAATPLKPGIVQLVKEGDALMRYKATLALLALDPGAPELLPAFRKELSGKYADDLFTEKISSAGIGLLEQVLATPTSIAEQETAKALLAKLKSESEHPAKPEPAK